MVELKDMKREELVKMTDNIHPKISGLNIEISGIEEQIKKLSDQRESKMEQRRGFQKELSDIEQAIIFRAERNLE